MKTIIYKIMSISISSKYIFKVTELWMTFKYFFKLKRNYQTKIISSFIALFSPSIFLFWGHCVPISVCVCGFYLYRALTLSFFEAIPLGPIVFLKFMLHNNLQWDCIWWWSHWESVLDWRTRPCSGDITVITKEIRVLPL